MIKLFFATACICLSIGSGIGYTISEHERRYLMQAANLEYRGSEAITKAKPIPMSRKELETRFTACIGRVMKLDRFTDKDLNDSLFECESQRSKS